jgi:hypothetical protein
MPIPLACDMSAIPASERQAHNDLTRHLMAAANAIQDLPDGLALRLPAETYDVVSRFVEYERRCCPFLTFSLTVAANRGPLELHLTGPEGVTAFLRAELRLPAA